MFNVVLKGTVLIEQRLGQTNRNDNNNRANISPLIISLPISLKSTTLSLSQLLSNTAQDAVFDLDFYDILGYIEILSNSRQHQNR